MIHLIIIFLNFNYNDCNFPHFCFSWTRYSSCVSAQFDLVKQRSNQNNILDVSGRLRLPFFFFLSLCLNVSQPSLSLCLSTNRGAGVVHSREVINATPSFATSWHEASSGGRCRRVLPPLCGARGNQQQITSSSNEARCHPFSPPLPSHHQSGGGWGGEGRMRGGGEAAGYGGEGKCRARPIIP